MRDHLSFAIPGTRVDVSMALELDASLAKCTGRQNDPAGSPAHPWRRCAAVTRSSVGHLYPNTPQETWCLWVSVMEKGVFLCLSQHCSPCGGNCHFPLVQCCPALKRSLCAYSCHAVYDLDVGTSWDPWLLP